MTQRRGPTLKRLSTIALGLTALTLGLAAPAQATTHPRPAPKPVPNGYIHAYDASGICYDEPSKSWAITFWVRKVSQPNVYPLRRIQIDSDCAGAIPFGFSGSDRPEVRFIADGPLHTTVTETTLAKKGWLNYNIQGTWLSGGGSRPLKDPYWKTYNADYIIHKNGKLTHHQIH